MERYDEVAQIGMLNINGNRRGHNGGTVLDGQGEGYSIEIWERLIKDPA